MTAIVIGILLVAATAWVTRSHYDDGPRLNVRRDAQNRIDRNR